MTAITFDTGIYYTKRGEPSFEGDSMITIITYVIANVGFKYPDQRAVAIKYLLIMNIENSLLLPTIF